MQRLRFDGGFTASHPEHAELRFGDGCVEAGAERQRQYAKGRLIMLALMVVLMIFHVLKQPLWPEMVWPIVPMLAVAFMPEKHKT